MGKSVKGPEPSVFRNIHLKALVSFLSTGSRFNKRYCKDVEVCLSLSLGHYFKNEFDDGFKIREAGVLQISLQYVLNGLRTHRFYWKYSLMRNKFSVPFCSKRNGPDNSGNSPLNVKCDYIMMNDQGHIKFAADKEHGNFTMPMGGHFKIQ